MEELEGDWDSGFEDDDLDPPMEGREQESIIRPSLEAFLSRIRPHPIIVSSLAVSAQCFSEAIKTCLRISDDPSCNANLPGFPLEFAEKYIYYIAKEVRHDLNLLDRSSVDTRFPGHLSFVGYSTELVIGILWFRRLFDDLTRRWKWRFAVDDFGPIGGPIMPSWGESVASVSSAEVQSIGRAISLIDRELPSSKDASQESGPAASAAGPPPGESGQVTKSSRKVSPLSKKATIVGCYYDHPEWSRRRIAKEIGVDPGTVCRVIAQIQAATQEQHLRDLPRGSKGMDGTLEAWDG